MQEYLLTCACGWEATGSENDIVSAAKVHGREIHNMDVSHEEAMAMAAPTAS